MPEHIRALIVVLILSTVVYAFAKRPSNPTINHSDFSRRRNIWLALTLTGFLAHNFWIYILIAGLLLIFSIKRESNLTALFFITLFCIPAHAVEIPGFGLINYFFALSHQRLLVLVILLPLFIALSTSKSTLPFGRTLPDKLLFFYILLTIALYLREASITDALRQAFYQFIDVFLPYFVISRSLRDLNSIRSAMLCFVIAVMILALIGTFESVRHWLLYQAMQDVLGMQSRFSSYGVRAGLLRATASVGQIPLGYLMVIGVGFFLFLQRFITSRFARWGGFLLLFSGLAASVSRGPWVGAVLLFTLFFFTGRQAIGHLSKFVLTCILALSIISFLPGGEKFTNLIPYFGESGQQPITYREKLLENSLIVIGRNPWFGSVDYIEAPEMEAMRQGQGIIDIVNTYIAIALESGYVGLSLFIGFFVTICWNIFRNFRRLPDQNSEEYLLGQALIATLGAILLIIFTVSSISVIPIVYWSVAGLSTAYINKMTLLRNNKIERQTSGSVTV